MTSLRKGLARRSFPFVYAASRPFGQQFDLCIPDGDPGVGGPNTFRSSMRKFLEKQNVTVTGSPFGRCRSLLVVQYFDYTKIRAIRKAGVRIVLRLDGLAYEEWAGQGWREMNAPVSRLYREYCDEVIFQSEYSALQADRFLGPRHPRSSVVVNGADPERFSPRRKLQTNSPVRLVTSGNFRLNHLIVPQIEALRILRESGLEVELTVIGPIADESLQWTVEEPGVRHLGSVSWEQIPQLLVESDIFVFSMLNAACPNSVVEAITAGLPVAGFASGSLPELCAFNRELLAPMPDKLIHADEEADGQALAGVIRKAIMDYPHFKSRSLKHCGDHSLETTVGEYRKALRI